MIFFFLYGILVSVTVCLHNALQPCRSRCGLIVETSPRCILLHPHFYIWSTCHTACSDVPVREELSYIWWWSKLKVISSDFFFFFWVKDFISSPNVKVKGAIYNSRAALYEKKCLKVFTHTYDINHRLSLLRSSWYLRTKLNATLSPVGNIMAEFSDSWDLFEWSSIKLSKKVI